MNILDKIVINKRREVQAAKARTSYTKLEESDFFSQGLLFIQRLFA